ncbi:unnamed protein product [Menidia menidia]|uniref:(Atlantic silverside) hypothetical protein n=1 Tax=Menidia menidia TaxID=238744 RepID=A0A8S4BFZ0_9TELE|nr:unnamed protein product [Menidia menidia]
MFGVKTRADPRLPSPLGQGSKVSRRPGAPHLPSPVSVTWSMRREVRGAPSMAFSSPTMASSEAETLWKDRLLERVQKLRITAEAGQDVSLPCETGTETKILLVEWIRPDLRPDVVLYYRDDHLFQNLQHASFRNRVDLRDEERRDGNASLVLRDVKMNDTGTYQCRLIQGAGAQDLMLISTVHLEVSPPPGAQDAQLELTVAVCVLCLLVVVVLLVLFHQKKACWLKWFPCRPPEEPELDLKSLLSKYPPEQRNQMLKSLLSVYPPAELKKLLETEDTSSL